MIRTLLAAAAVAALAGAAHAQVVYEPSPAYDQASAYDPSGLTVYGQPRDAYIIRLDTRGKDAATVRREISWAAETACSRAPRLTGNLHETRPGAVSACVTQARHDALAQFDRIQAQRRYNGYIYAAAY
jgi:hypothetical protein